MEASWTPASGSPVRPNTVNVIGLPTNAVSPNALGTAMSMWSSSLSLFCRCGSHGVRALPWEGYFDSTTLARAPTGTNPA